LLNSLKVLQKRHQDLDSMALKKNKINMSAPKSGSSKKCWPGYEKKGTKKMYGKTYNNCVKK
jgi:hypothetical protein